MGWTRGAWGLQVGGREGEREREKEEAQAPLAAAALPGGPLRPSLRLFPCCPPQPDHELAAAFVRALRESTEDDDWIPLMLVPGLREEEAGAAQA